ncbi:MAG: hypothetical protein FWF34_00695 [Alphaproteobacteria bacterium]|nr:hypothetical protein [Alphaproteobacteria bacterium]MCL2889764.1 hypothetical protein [Alphaproteobacteria bacterium]
MGKFINTQNSFALGEISSEFFARSDIAAASRGLSKLENMDVLPGGGLRRRPGTIRLFETRPDAMIVPMLVSDDDNYMLILSTRRIEIYKDDKLVDDILTPWNSDEIRGVQYAQRFGTMIFTHPNHAPQILQKNPDGSFTLYDFEFSADANGNRLIPFIKFDDAANIKLTLTSHPNGNNFATITASTPFWTSANIGHRLMVGDRQWLITGVTSSTIVTAQTNAGHTLPNGPISDWRETAFSARRGWPTSITFHQDRLVFGGARDWPCGVWMSKVGDHKNFDVGTGLDDEAIFLTLLSSTRQQICTVASSDNLQILTTAGEWAISSKPLTPSTINIKQHTSVGSRSDRYLQPQKIEGSTAFVSKNDSEIRELVLDQIGETYDAVDLCALSKHIMKTPVDIAYHDRSCRLFVVMADGSMAVLTRIAATSVSAWAVYRTMGDFKSVAVMNGEVFVAVNRDIGTFVEKFSDSVPNDSGGYGFSFTASGMPIFASGHNPKKLRLTKISARLMDTKSLFFRMDGRMLRAPLPNNVHAPDSNGFTGDVSINLLGTATDTIQPLWTITSSEPLPATILSITAEGRYSI